MALRALSKSSITGIIFINIFSPACLDKLDLFSQRSLPVIIKFCRKPQVSVLHFCQFCLNLRIFCSIFGRFKRLLLTGRLLCVLYFVGFTGIGSIARCLIETILFL